MEAAEKRAAVAEHTLELLKAQMMRGLQMWQGGSPPTPEAVQGLLNTSPAMTPQASSCPASLGLRMEREADLRTKLRTGTSSEPKPKLKADKDGWLLREPRPQAAPKMADEKMKDGMPSAGAHATNGVDMDAPCRSGCGCGCVVADAPLAGADAPARSPGELMGLREIGVVRGQGDGGSPPACQLPTEEADSAWPRRRCRSSTRR